MAEWLKAVDCKSIKFNFTQVQILFSSYFLIRWQIGYAHDCKSCKKGSTPFLIFFFETGGITQLVECMLCKHKVISSNLITSKKNDITQLVEQQNHNLFVIGSTPIIVRSKNIYGLDILFDEISEYSVVVAYLFWEQKAMCSNHITPSLIKFFRLEKIAQSVRVLTCHVKCCGFKSRFSRLSFNITLNFTLYHAQIKFYFVFF